MSAVSVTAASCSVAIISQSGVEKIVFMLIFGEKFSWILSYTKLGERFLVGVQDANLFRKQQLTVFNPLKVISE